MLAVQNISFAHCYTQYNQIDCQMSSSSLTTSLLVITKLEEMHLPQMFPFFTSFRELHVATSTAEVTDGHSSPMGIAGNIYFYDHASNGYTPTATLGKHLCVREKIQVWVPPFHTCYVKYAS